MSDKPGGYVGQDFGELSRAAVLESRPREVMARPHPQARNASRSDAGEGYAKRCGRECWSYGVLE